MDVTTPNFTAAGGEYLQHAVGRLGEQTVAFHLGQNGYVVMYGPSGSTRAPRGSPFRVHQPTTKGLDMIAFRPSDGEILILDNKAGSAGGAIDDVGAFTQNLGRKLRNRIEKIERASAGLPPLLKKDVDKVLDGLRKAEQALAKGAAWPKNVKLVVSNAAGAAPGVTKRLAKQLGKMGIEFMDFRKAAQVVRTPLAQRLAGKTAAKALRKKATVAELEALKKLATGSVGKRVAEAAKDLTPKVIEKGLKWMPTKALPKLIGKLMLRASAKAAAKRAASLLPIIGWGFAAKDAYAGFEDILRGHTARGWAGIGLAVADVGADAAHLGDAVSGVGGTMLSLGVQGMTIAGQIKIEMERMQDKLDELQREIEQRGALPDDKRLEEEFGMDEEAIAELKQSFNNPAPETPPTEDDLPPPPDWGQDEEPMLPDDSSSRPASHPDTHVPAHPHAPPLPPPNVPVGPVPFWDLPIA